MKNNYASDIVNSRGFIHWRSDLDVALQGRYRVGTKDLAIRDEDLAPLVPLSLQDAAKIIANHYRLSPIDVSREVFR